MGGHERRKHSGRVVQDEHFGHHSGFGNAAVGNHGSHDGVVWKKELSTAPRRKAAPSTRGTVYRLKQAWHAAHADPQLRFESIPSSG